MFLNIDSSGLVMTADGVDILFQPALGGISVLQTALAGMSIPELVINANGNLTIQADQGPPPLELDEFGEVVINNSYYNRFNLRPNGLALLSEANEQGIELLPHPTFPEEVILAVNFTFNSILRQQILNSAPIDLFALITELENIAGVSDVELRALSVLFLKYNGNGFYLLPDYMVRRVEEFNPVNIGLSIVGDINLDGYADLNMVYANGDEQYLFYYPIP
jgi:hypothetical protein